ncbi:MAG: Holliday junction resolvase RecU [Clostridiales bacterium]|jgi:recombination protein U|nr:Holliday junction resolvase RecU [Clostridiales bacterium]
MGYWATRGLRGSVLEELINSTNESYLSNGLAVVHKIPTPITPVSLDKENRNINLAYFEQKSTVDYIGVAQGFPICFDAKETSLARLPVQNIHKHQIEFLQAFENQKGIAFLIVYFKRFKEFYFLPFGKLNEYWQNAQNGGRKSIPYSDFDKQYLIRCKSKYLVHYLEPLNTYLCNKL